jgi:16S rRNA (cytosine1402-N4)-methyltransferase
MSENNPKPQRRVRYNGTHPRLFNEKYKELNPDNYAADIEKIKQQGRTPAGMHRSIMVAEVLQILSIKSGEMGYDATLGYGGHTAAMLPFLKSKGKIIATDVDAEELQLTKARLEALGFNHQNIVIKKMNFSNIDLISQEYGKFDFVLADLGVSSMQIDNPKRGFSFKVNGPLDLRLNQSTGKPASALLKKIDQLELQEVFISNSDEPHAEILAKAICTRIKQGFEISTTTHLFEIINDTLDFLPQKEKKDTVKKTCQRCFQALRIEVNKEFFVLEKFLEKLPEALASGARVAILSFHSGEDRRVKKSFQEFFRNGLYSKISNEPIRPTVDECVANPRSKSTKLRWAIKK